ncbi:MAG: hypothetical protein HYV59_10905 [Planctomycetes bacterium]|nr:hypothetical protein [Planctomycetota bacterium]
MFLSINGKNVPVTLKELSALKLTIVTYDFWWLVSAFKKKTLPLPSSIIDISQVAKLLIGRSHKEYNNDLPWSIWNLLSTYNKLADKQIHIKDIIYQQSFSDHIERGYAMDMINKWQMELWSKFQSQLIEKGEKKRYFEVEMPIAKILYERQYQGIRVNEKRLLTRLDNLDRSINASARELRARWGIIDATDEGRMRKWLAEHGFPFIANNINKKSFDGLLEIGSYSSTIISLYHSYRRSLRDKKLLLGLGVIGRKRIFPIFEGLGTVTSRITVKSPMIQHLKSNSRDVFAPDRGFEFIYPDYCQFEPGILADDSKDEKLIQNYNSKDIYKALSRDLFGHEEGRKTAKKIFLSFSYGMEKDNIIELLNEISNNEVDYKDAIVKFFEDFNKIDDWRIKIQKELLETGKICTRMGNCRYRESKFKYLRRSEKRWAVSQRIQGTASLILKKAILDVNRELGDVQFLIPMHDAVLYQLPKGLFPKYKKKIETIFKENFASICSTIVPRISFENFHKPE